MRALSNLTEMLLNGSRGGRGDKQRGGEGFVGGAATTTRTTAMRRTSFSRFMSRRRRKGRKWSGMWGCNKRDGGRDYRRRENRGIRKSL